MQLPFALLPQHSHGGIPVIRPVSTSPTLITPYTVAAIAHDKLEKERPDVLKKVKEILAVLKPMTTEGNHTFIEAACWSDMIKDRGLNAMNDWHFADNHVMRGDVKVDKAMPINITWALVSIL